MSEAKNAEAELAKVIREAFHAQDMMEGLDLYVSEAERLAAAILAAGYAKRSETLEEAAKVADAHADMNEKFRAIAVQKNGLDGSYHLWAKNEANDIAFNIRSLKGQP